MQDVIISVDLGGTNIRAARLDRELNILKRVQINTESQLGCASTIERIKSQVREVFPTDGTPVMGIGISAPGPVNPKTGILVAPPNLGDCHNVPLESELRTAFGVPTYLGNDANVAALAEVALGAARGFRDAIFITISTGIGGGVVTDGRLLLGKEGLAAEVGHMVMIADGHVSTLEKESSGPSIARKAHARLTNGDTSIIREMVGGDLDLITGKVVGDAAQQGDALALDVVRRAGQILGYGVTTLLHLFNPQILIIGGGVSKLGDLLLDPMREAMKASTIDPVYWKDLVIVPAALGDNVSVIGAAALVLTQGGAQDVTAAVARIDAE